VLNTDITQPERLAEEKIPMKLGAGSLLAAFLLVLPLTAFAGSDPCADLGGDTDGDEVCDDHDNCPTKPNGPNQPSPQADSDVGGGDGVGDVCDNCIAIFQVSGGSPGFCDTDSDGYGNACDADFDNGGPGGAVDFNAFFLPDFIAGVPRPGIGTDMDCGGTVNAIDFNTYYLPQFLQGLPGPSGWSCAGVIPCLAP
jgi:hypothetical protein